MRLKLKLAALGFALFVASWFIAGCGTTFEQRVPYYKAAVHFGIDSITNGTATNLVGTLRGLVNQ